MDVDVGIPAIVLMGLGISEVGIHDQMRCEIGMKPDLVVGNLSSQGHSDREGEEGVFPQTHSGTGNPDDIEGELL
jgi:hypothetical protein